MVILLQAFLENEYGEFDEGLICCVKAFRVFILLIIQIRNVGVDEKRIIVKVVDKEQLFLLLQVNRLQLFQV